MAGEEDIIAQAASATQSMVPQLKGDLMSFGPTPLVQPPPMPRMQQPQQQFAKAGNEFQTSGGRKKADRQALFTNTANLIKSGSDFIQAKKQRALTMDIDRLISAQEGLQEAQASGNQEGIQKNSAIINDITSDPKKVKMLQKAFNIDLFGDGKNKNENQALQEAWKNYNQKKQQDPSALNPIAQKLQASQPMRQQLSPEAQAQAAAIKAGLIPKAGEVLRAYQDNFKVLMTAKDTESRNTAMEKAAQLRASAEQYHADKLIDAATIRTAGQQVNAEINARARRYIADQTAATWDKRLSMMDKWASMKTGNSSVIKNLSMEAKTYNDRLKILSSENGKLLVELNKKGTSIFGIKFGAMSPQEANTARNKFMMNNLEMKKLNSDLDTVTKKLQTLDTMGVINMKELSSGTSGGGDVTNVPDSELPDD